MSVHLIGVGPGPVDLLTVRASRLIALSSACLYPRDTISSKVESLCTSAARVVDTTGLAPREVSAEIRSAVDRGEQVVVLFAGDPAQHPGFAELTDELNTLRIGWELVPGVPAHPAQVVDPNLGAAAPPAPDPGTGTASAPGPAAVQAAVHAAVQASAPPAPMPETTPGRILVLGGTRDARRLSDLMGDAGLDVVTALAGTMPRPRLPRNEVRIEEFGGAEGLAYWLGENAVSVVIDATDPFTPEISDTAHRAAAETGIPLLRLSRPPWEPRPGDDWIRVPELAEAARVVRERFRRPMLTVGVQGPAAFAGDTRGSYLIRCAEPPPDPLPHRYLLILDRGPFDPDSERTVMSRHRIDVLVTRNSGGEDSAAKLSAARDLRLPVVMVDRPPERTWPDPGRVDTAYSVEDAARWLVRRFGSR